MITGAVSPDGKARIRITIAGPSGETEVEAVVDTGFTGYVTLPTGVVNSLGLDRAGLRTATLADGSTVALSSYRATVLWDGQRRRVVVLAAEGAVLTGMRLMRDYKLTIAVIDGGPVLIEALT